MKYFITYFGIYRIGIFDMDQVFRCPADLVEATLLFWFYSGFEPPLWFLIVIHRLEFLKWNSQLVCVFEFIFIYLFIFAFRFIQQIPWGGLWVISSARVCPSLLPSYGGHHRVLASKHQILSSRFFHLCPHRSFRREGKKRNRHKFPFLLSLLFRLMQISHSSSRYNKLLLTYRLFLPSILWASLQTSYHSALCAEGELGQDCCSF